MNTELYDSIKSQVDYDNLTGLFTWKTNRANNKILAGDPVGVSGNGMLKVNFTFKGNTRSVALHRLAYYITTGECPNRVHHRNDNVMDNRSINLSIDPDDKSDDIIDLSDALPRGVIETEGGYLARPNVGGVVLKFKDVFKTIEEASAKVAKWTTDVDAYFNQTTT